MAGLLLNRNRQVPAEETPAFGGIAERFRRAGDLDRAIALCRDGLKRFPDQLSAKVTLGWSLLDKGQYEAARAELEQVLRRAPDNLAAIRGLAELHDRSEGTLSADHESWKSDEAPAGLSSSVSETAAPGKYAAGDLQLAPIQVSLSDIAGNAQILHTAAQAELEAEAAASASDVIADLRIEPVAPAELEDPAAVSMAAAEPMPFFVVDPAEDALAVTPEPEDASPEAFEAAALADISADSAAAFDVDITAGSFVGIEDTPVPAFQVDVEPEVAQLDTEPVIDVAADTADGTGDWAAAALAELASDIGSDEISTAPAVVWGDEVAQTQEPGADVTSWLDAEFSAPEATPVAALETLDDIDEMAGLELAEAIKALEEAAKRVEAKFAVPPPTNVPVAGSDEIAAFEFVDALGYPLALNREPEREIQPTTDVSPDGAFELVAPDLTSLELAPESDAVAQDDSDASVVDGLAESLAYTPEFSFDSVLEDVDAAVASETDVHALVDADVSAEGATDAPVALSEPEPESEPVAVSDAIGEIEIAETVEASAELDSASSDTADRDESNTGAGEWDVTESVAYDVTVAPIEAELDIVSAPEAEADAVIEAEGSASADAGFGSVDVDMPMAAFESVEPVDEPVLPLAFAFGESAAAVTTDVVAPYESIESIDAGLETYDVVDLPVVALIGTAVDEEVVMPVAALSTSPRSPLAALEKFLRQVQARQLELRSETVA